MLFVAIWFSSIGGQFRTGGRGWAAGTRLPPRPDPAGARVERAELTPAATAWGRGPGGACAENLSHISCLYHAPTRDGVRARDAGGRPGERSGGVGGLGGVLQAGEDTVERALVADVGEHALPPGLLHGGRHDVAGAVLAGGGGGELLGRGLGDLVGVGAQGDRLVDGGEAAALDPDLLGVGGGKVADEVAHAVVVLHGDDEVRADGDTALELRVDGGEGEEVEAGPRLNALELAGDEAGGEVAQVVHVGGWRALERQVAGLLEAGGKDGLGCAVDEVL